MQVFSGNLTREGKLSSYKRADGIVNQRYQNAIAVDTNEKDRDGEKITNFVNFTIFGKRAEVFAAKFQKGDTVHLAGELVPRSFEKDGTRYSTSELRFVGQLDENQARRIQTAIKDAVWPDSARASQQQQDAQADQMGEQPGDSGEDMVM